MTKAQQIFIESAEKGYEIYLMKPLSGRMYWSCERASLSYLMGRRLRDEGYLVSPPGELWKLYYAYHGQE